MFLGVPALDEFQCSFSLRMVQTYREQEGIELNNGVKERSALTKKLDSGMGIYLDYGLGATGYCPTLFLNYALKRDFSLEMIALL